jgi:hypothetical protein
VTVGKKKMSQAEFCFFPNYSAIWDNSVGKKKGIGFGKKAHRTVNGK